jgi:tetratricopeptide (TPR) repeat protein
MRNRRLLAALLLISAGCSSNSSLHHNEQTALSPHAAAPAFQNANDRESLTLDQVGSPPLMPGATTRPGAPPIESVRLFAQARIAMLDNDRAGAISLLQKAVALDPASFELHTELADQYDAASNPLALVEWEKAAAIEPNHLDLLISIARHQLSGGNPAGAIARLRQARLTDEYLSDDPSSAEADFLLARALQDADYDRAALSVYETLLNRLETQSRIVSRSAQGAALLDRPNVLAIHIAALYEKHRQHDEALVVLRSAAAQVPGDFPVAAQIVRDIAAMGQREQSLAAATDLVSKFHGDDASVGLLEETTGSVTQTQAVLQSLAKRDQASPSLYGALSDIQASAGHDAESNQTLTTALSRWPDDLRLIRRRINRLRAQGEFAAAAKLIAEQIARKPTDDLELQTIFDPLTRPSLHGRLRTADMRAVQVSPGATAAKLLLVSHCAAVDRGDADQRHVLDEALDAAPPCLPAWRERLTLIISDTKPPAEIANAAMALIARAEKQLPAAAVDELRGQLALSAKDGQASAAALARAVRAGARSAEVYLDFAAALQLLKDDSGAITVLERLVGEHPLCVQAHEALIDAFQALDQPAEAERARQTWVATDAQSAAARRTLAVQAIAEQRKQDAHQILVDLFNRDSSNPETLATIIAYDADNASWVATMHAHFDHEHWNYSLGEALIELLRARNDMPAALQIADIMRNAVASDSDLLYKLSGLYTRLNAANKSEAVLQQIVAMDPSFAGPSNDLGYTWVSQGRKLTEAESLIRKAVSIEPDNPAFLDSLGWVLYKRGQFADAVAMLARSVGTSSLPDPLVLDHLGDAQWRLGQHDQATRTWQQAADRIAKMSPDAGDDLDGLKASLEKKRQSAGSGKNVPVAPVGAEK